MISPREAKEAVTPPVVGSVSTVMYSSPAALCRATAPEVFAICIRDTMPSCIRAPPDAVNTMMGSPASVACSKARVSFSPTTLPILPIMYRGSITASVTGIPPIRQSPVIMASVSPVFARSTICFFS